MKFDPELIVIVVIVLAVVAYFVIDHRRRGKQKPDVPRVEPAATITTTWTMDMSPKVPATPPPPVAPAASSAVAPPPSQAVAPPVASEPAAAPSAGDGGSPQLGPAPSARTTMLERYPSAQACQNDADAIGFDHAIMVDSVLIHHGFGPAALYFTQPDGSVATTPPVRQSPPIPPTPVQSSAPVDPTVEQEITLGQQVRYIAGSFTGGQTLRFKVHVPADIGAKIIDIRGGEYGSNPRMRKAVLSLTPDGPPLPGVASYFAGSISPELIARTDGADPTLAMIAPGSVFYARFTNEDANGQPSAQPSDVASMYVDFYVYAAQ